MSNSALFSQSASFKSLATNVTTTTTTTTTSTANTTTVKKSAAYTNRAIEAALLVLSYAIRTSVCIQEKMLLPGHKQLRDMSAAMGGAQQCPRFVACDMLGWHLLAEKKRNFKNEIEEEIISLAPQFEEKKRKRTYDEKVRTLAEQSDRTITWIHLLNYQSKLQSTSSMLSFNILKNGANRHKFSQLYTVGLTPTFRCAHMTASRLFKLHRYLLEGLDIYRRECEAPAPITDVCQHYAKKLSVSASLAIASASASVAVASGNETQASTTAATTATTTTTTTTAKYTRTYEGNVTRNLRNEEANKSFNVLVWPANWAPHSPAVAKAHGDSSSEPQLDYVLTFAWYKELVVSLDNATTRDGMLLAIIAVKDSLTSNKIRYKWMKADAVNQLHDK